jgi:SAM-dependent methyltransferase
VKNTTKDNQKTWDQVAEKFINASALPVWGPFGVGKSLNLISDIKGKTFLEIGCGSGRSIKYLTDKGAKKVYGLDFSQEQIKEASKFNADAIRNGKVKLFQSPMEEIINIEPVDLVYSVYALGWTQEPKKTLKNIYTYLKPGGKFIWSWDHTFFTNVEYEQGKFVLKYSYHEEKPIFLKDWKGGNGAHIFYRKSATWFKLQRDTGFGIEGYHEPEPEDLSHGHIDPSKYYSIQKAKLIPPTFIFVSKKPSL